MIGVATRTVAFVRKFQDRFLPKLFFGNLPWRPYGRVPFYVAYYPDSLRSDKSMRELFGSWIAGNRVNNNGDVPRFITLLLNARHILANRIPGDFAELGVWRGNSAALLARVAQTDCRRLFLFDTFTGFDQRDIVGLDANRVEDFTNTSTEYVCKTIQDMTGVVLVPGFFPSTVTQEISECVFSLVHLDCDLYEPMRAGLDFFYPRLSPGGMMILHDYSSGVWDGAKQAIDEFCSAKRQQVVLVADKSGTAIVIKPHQQIHSAASASRRSPSAVPS